MANITSAEGTITVVGPAKSVRAFMSLAELMVDWYYSTEIFDRNEIVTECENKLDTEIVTVTSNFYGQGRWNYENNIRALFPTLHSLNTEPNERYGSEWRDKDTDAMAQLNRAPISLLFKHKDHDNTSFFVDEEFRLSWEKDLLPAVTVDQLKAEDIPLTAENFDNLADEVYFDHSTYTVNKLWEDESVDWVKEITAANYDTPPDLSPFDFKDKDSDKMKALMANIGEILDNQAENTNCLWAEVYEWFEDEDVEEAIIDAINKN